MYNLVLKEQNETLLKSIVSLKKLKACRICNDYKSLTFHAKNITLLNKVIGSISDKQMSFFFNCLTNQLKFLIESKYESFSYLNPREILLIDNVCICLSSNLLALDDTGNLEIFLPFDKTVYNAPEINAITRLPHKTRYECVFYSLAVLVIYNKFNSSFPKSTIASREEITSFIKPLYHSKLYYTLMRCLEKDPADRSIVCV
jgi:hypothetical protein|tara:strand:+ start:991 stop:1596 length:606 start_codon:yes stop_codon:yes gene_type:complete